MRGFLAVLKKEAIHIMRDRGTLRMALLIPALQLTLFGLIDTNVKNVSTVVLDLSRSRESRELMDELVATHTFRIVHYASSRDEMKEMIVAGRAAVGIEIPPDYHRRRLEGSNAQFLVLIDGSDSAIASQTLAAVDGLALSKSLEELSRLTGTSNIPIEPKPQILFNPDSRSANLLIPGLVAILLTFSGTLLSAYAIVRERERGTLEQLMVTPVSPLGVIMGKLIPYLILAFIQLVVVLTLMTTVFRVPIHGNVLLLALFALIYLLALLCLGLMVSARARTQVEATQMAQGILLPSILLSGYIFPLTSLPLFLRGISYLLPATHFVAISRGIIIRGAGFSDLWQHAVALVLIAGVLVFGGTRAFRRTVS